MANRTVKTSLVAEVSGYISGFDQAAKKTRELGSETEKLGQKREAIDGLGRASIAFGAVAATAVALAVAKYAEFDQAMSSVQAATHASAGEMRQLRDAAVDAGARTVFSATEAANAIEELSKAGVGTNDILRGGLAGALDLASAGELQVADAAQIAATAMTQFNLKGNEVPHVADLLAAGAGKAQGSVQDLSAALNQGGLVASQAGFSINETTGTLAAFASAGLLGSDAGTSLKTAILALQNPSTKAAGTMRQYGIDVYDSSGKMLSFGGIAAQLKDKLGGLSDEQRNAALATIFGNDAVRAANVLYNEGADGIATWTGKVNDNGYAAETARLKLDNLRGDVEKLGGSFDTALINSGTSANGVLRGIVQSATMLVDVVGGAPAPILGAGVAMAALAASTTLVGGAALIGIPKLAAFKAQLDTMGISVKSAIGRTAAWGAGLGAVTLGISLLVNMQAQAAAATDELADTFDKQTGALTKYSRAAVAKRLADGGEFEAARKAGVSQKELTDAVLEGGDALDSVQKKLGSRNTFGGMFTGAAYEAGWAQQNIANVANSVEDARKKFQDQKAANSESGDVAQTAAEAYKQEAASVEDLSSELSDLIAQFDKVNGVNQDAVSSNAAYREALAGLADQVEQQRKNTKDYTTSLDENTAVGAGNASMLSDLAGKAQEAASKQYAVDQSTMGAKDAADKYASTLAQQRQKFIESATAAGFNAGEVKKLADRVFQLPSEKQIKILASTGQAQTDLNAFITRNDGRVITVRQQLITEAIKSGAAPGAAKAAYNANGSVMDFYGDGGVAENHVAQFAAAGTMRVWAEPETGGEAYIPLAASKRTRSLAIWEETGRRLQAFADGDVRGGTPTYVPTPPQIVYASAQGSAADARSMTFAPQFVSSGDQRQDFDDAWFQFVTKMQGGR
ncbi:phage tail tape measure protein [Curtobacterium flaccumfaciens]|uniref:phage tail tape measure protein n=1 Tax=Curtobacterium flaccumfaciens TaxID=2035 RepID=UPI0021FC1306|nr:phage tail tape measure protein [Curtobacterium flaccumfaciens]UWD83661.1 phage tail tape measure protein [Curtobacterium flaccumfaciens]